MQSGEGPHNPWQAQPPASLRRFLPAADTFSDSPGPANQPALQDGSLRQGHNPTSQYISPYAIFQEPPTSLTNPGFEDPYVPFASAHYQEPLSHDFLTGGPVVHEGFIPAPGQEDEDVLYPTFEDPFQDGDLESSDDDDSEFERTLAETAERDDSEKDKDYSTEEEELVADPDEALDDDLFEEVDQPAPKRGRGKSRSTRGGRRGRASTRGRGGLNGHVGRRKRKPGVRGRPKGKIGPRAVADPGPEFRELQRLANESYMRSDFQQASAYALQAVALNPEIFSAHNTLSEIYSAMGQDDLSVRALIVGANTKRDTGLWWLVLERIDQVDEKKFPQYTDDYKKNLKLGCLKSLIVLDRDNYEARSRKLELDAERGPGRISACVQQCQRMLAIRPHEYDILRQMAILGTSTPKAVRIHLSRIIKSYDTSIAHFMSHEDPASSTLDWSLLNIYLDLLDHAGDYDYALYRLKTLSRWKQGRQDERFWDEQPDDREFDIDDSPRRIAVPEFSRKSVDAKYGETLPLEMRVKMGIFRLQRSSPNFAEAMIHLEMLEPENREPDAPVWDYPDLFRLVADTLHKTGHDKDALRFYEPVLDHAQEQLGLKSMLGLHTCYTNMGEHSNAEKLIPIFKEWNASYEDLAILAKFFEDQGMEKEAWDRAEIVFGNKGAWRLRRVKYGAYDKLVAHYKEIRKIARGKHGVRKSRVKKYMRKLQMATNAKQDDSENEDEPGERPSLGPMGKRPGKGLFRAKGRLPKSKPKTFLPAEPVPPPAPKSRTEKESAAPPAEEESAAPPIEEAELGPPEPEVIPTLEGTDVPLDAIARKLFRTKLEKLAADHADELKAARAQHRAVVASFERLDQLCDAADDGDETATTEYLSIARELVEEFSTFDLFYSDRKNDFRGYFRRITSGELWTDAALMALAVEADRIEDGEEERELEDKPDANVQDFWGVHFERWFDVFGRYALLLGRNGEKERCFSVLDVALQSNVFYRNADYHHRIEICRLSCALALDDSPQAVDAVRWLLRTYPFSSELFRLFSAANRLCSTSEAYSTGKTLKVVTRYIKTMDYVLLSPEQRVWFNFRGDDRSQWMQHAVSTDFVKHVKNHDPALFALCGHVLMCGGSYTGALNYFFRAFALTPEDPVVNLSIGIAYIQHAMKRLSENRQFQIQQGLSFINRYYELRTKDDVALHCSEAEYNIGRVWHGLGLMTQALTAYERCIALSERVKGEAMGNDDGGAAVAEDFAAEAAFGIQAICVLSGDFERACRITESALVIE